VVGGDRLESLSEEWQRFAADECGSYSPLYSAICSGVAEDAELLALVAAAPPRGQQPNVLLAAVHYLLLGGLRHPLAEVYAGRGDPGEAPALFRDICFSEQAAIRRLLSTRHTQTNEPGRAAVVALGLATAADEWAGEPIGLLDAGCSAGLNLLVDRYRIEYGGLGALGPADSPVTIRCEVRGESALPTELPTIAARIGLDRAPVDVTMAEDARWLLACVWPDTGRLARTAAAIELARRYPLDLMAGDMIGDLNAALDTFDPALPVVVVTTSSCAYLSVDERLGFRAVIEHRARRQRLAWLSVESAGVVDVVPVPPATADEATAASVLGLVTFDTGRVVGRGLARCQGHGAWLDLGPAMPRRLGEARGGA
jgi:hypothetical protein